MNAALLQSDRLNPTLIPTRVRTETTKAAHPRRSGPLVAVGDLVFADLVEGLVDDFELLDGVHLARSRGRCGHGATGNALDADQLFGHEFGQCETEERPGTLVRRLFLNPAEFRCVRVALECFPDSTRRHGVGCSTVSRCETSRKSDFTSAPSASTRRTVSSSPAVSTSDSASLAPRPASSRARARPIPEPAPVTTATLPVNVLIVRTPCLCCCRRPCSPTRRSDLRLRRYGTHRDRNAWSDDGTRT